MPTKKKPLEKRLQQMSEDIQIGGDVNFRAMGCAVVLGEATKTLSVATSRQSPPRRTGRLLGRTRRPRGNR